MDIFPDDTASLPDAAFAELHCRSNYSFLCGASHPEELVQQAHALGYTAIAITDECSVCGVVKAHIAAKEVGLKLIVGSEFRIATDNGTEVDIVLLAPTHAAYKQLSSLITFARRRSPKGSYELELNDLAERVDACYALWLPRQIGITELMQQGRILKSLLPRLWVSLELFLADGDFLRTANASTLASSLQLPLVASNDVHMHAVARKPLLDTLTAIRHRTTVSALGTQRYANSERHLRAIAELQEIYPEDLLQESVKIAQSCTFSLDELRYEYPAELVPPERTPAEHLRQLTYEGAQQRWPEGVPQDVEQLIEKELALIAELRYEPYFLTVHDIVRFARGRKILCQGRGSAANSAVCYCLHITEVDPDRIHVLFERFVSKERQEPPDIDVDFEHERREEVIQYIYERYGRDRAALAATLITYRPRSAIRDVGKALGFSLETVDLLAKSMAWWDKKEMIEERLRTVGLDPQARTVRQFLYLVEEILGFPRHLSQHVGGFVISSGSLSDLVPVENAAMEDRTVIQWDKYDLEALGLLKIDVLALGMLTAIRKTLAYVNDFRQLDGRQKLTVASVPAEDPATYRMLQKADSVGVFQVESRAQMTMLPRLKPQCFYDLVIEVAIVRPGPIQGNMVHPYLRRRAGTEEVSYPSPQIRKVLSRTLGVPIFQEQVIELAMVAAGFSAGEADQLRRAMAAWRRRGGLEKFERKLIDGMAERGHSREFADRIFQQIQGFGEYGFPESHAASFALLAYISAWLKCHEPAAFCCGLLNSLPMGFYSPSQLVQDVARHGVEVRGIDVQCSGWDFRLEGPAQAVSGYARPQAALRVGLRQIKGLHRQVGERVAEHQPYQDIDDLARRADLTDRDLTVLARAGALHSLTGHRYQAHWDAAGVDRPAGLWKAAGVKTRYHTEVSLPGPDIGQDMLSDYKYLGLSLGPHPLSLLRSRSAFSKCTPAEELEAVQSGQLVHVAGLVTGRQRPSTKSGVVFVTLEDETGNSNLVVWSQVLEEFRAEVLQGQLLIVQGVVEREGDVIHVVASDVRDMSEHLKTLASRDDGIQLRARDFR